MPGEPQETPSERPRPDQEKQKSIEPVVPREFVQEEVRKQTHAVGFQVAMGGSPASTLIEKFEPAHIDKVLEYTRKDSSEEHQRKVLYYVGGLLTLLILSGVFLYFGKDALLEKLVVAIIGFLGGYGVGKSGKL